MVGSAERERVNDTGFSKVHNYWYAAQITCTHVYICETTTQINIQNTREGTS